MTDTTTTPPHMQNRPAYNLTGVDYTNIPRRKIDGPIIDVHTHTRDVGLTREYLRVADEYGISKIWTMAPLEDVEALQQAFPGRFEFIAIPKWQNLGPGADFIAEWISRLDGFYQRGSRLIKFHVAPGTQKRTGMDLDSPAIQQVIRHAYDLGYHFMSHVGDPRAWFGEDRKYKPSEGQRSFEQQFPMLERMLEKYPDRIHMGAHMGGSLEDLDALQKRLDRFPHYIVDSSATKWIVRGIALQSLSRVRDFFIQNQDRILFGSDLVVGEKYNHDHYASRYWVHQKLWETDFKGFSPIEDPDAPEGKPRLEGLDLPPEILEKFYRTNAQRWLHGKVLGKTNGQ